METAAHQSASARFDMNNTASAKEPDWVQVCLDAARNDDLFAYFRSTDAFRRVIDGSPKVAGIWNLRRLLRNPDFLDALPRVLSTDTVGLPPHLIEFRVKDLNGEPRTCSLSPTTIRYANNAANCLSLFGKSILDGSVEIYEIGSGFGGECKVFNDFCVTRSKSSLGKKWHLFDLPSSYGLIKRFLTQFNYTYSLEELSSFKPNAHASGLVLSNGAFSEMRGALLDEYFEKVIVPAQFGYFITNFETHSAPQGGWTTAEFIERLHSSGKVDATLLPTTEYLSYFDWQAGSKLIVFGHSHIRKSLPTPIDVLRIRLLSFLLKGARRAQDSFIGSWQ